MSFLSRLGLSSVFASEGAHGSAIIKNEDSTSSPKTSLPHAPHLRKGVDLSHVTATQVADTGAAETPEVFVVFRGLPDSDASLWTDTYRDDDGDLCVPVDITQSILDQVKVWVKVNDAKLSRVSSQDVVLDSDGDVRVKLALPQPPFQAWFTVVIPPVGAPDSYFENLFCYNKGKGWSVRKEGKWVDIHLPWEHSYPDQFFATFNELDQNVD